MTNDKFDRFSRMAKEEFGVSIVKTDCSNTSQILLSELKLEIAAIEKLNKIRVILSEKNGVADSQEFGLSYGQVLDYLEQIEDVMNN